MKKNKHNKKDDDQKKVVQTQEPEEVETEEEEIEVNDPGDCIGHWAECQECEMCEIQDSCQAMTKNINGEEENAEEPEKAPAEA